MALSNLPSRDTDGRDTDGRPKWTVAYLVTAGLMVTVVAAVLTLVSLNRMQASVYQLVERDIEHAAVVADIVRYDEILTMSSHLAAASGERRWIERYLENEPKLTSAIERSMDLAPSIYAQSATSETNDANDALVAMETRSFELVDAGQIAEAYALLTGSEYAEQKRIYAAGMGKAQLEIQSAMDQHVQHALRSLARTRTAASGGAVLLTAGWLVVLWLVVRAARKQARSEHDLVEARLRAEAATRAKATFLANMSHEIRTPLNGVIGMTELLEQTSLDEEQQQFLHNARSSGESLLHIVDDILDYSKIAAGKMTLESVPFDVVATLEDVATLLAPRAAANHVELLLSIDASAPRHLVGDPTRLKQILLNLAGNAVKFTTDGEIRIDAFAAEASSRLQADSGVVGLGLRVADTGIGIAAERLSSLFVAFEQADTSTTRRFGGTGLGLTISRHLTELMGGELAVESTLGRGTTFSATLPFTAGSLEDTAPSPTLTLDTKPRILVVEDHEGAREILSRMLRDMACEVECAASGEDALEVLASSAPDRPFDIAMVDCRLPGISGTEVARSIAKLPDGRAPSIVLMSADLVRTSEDGGRICARLLKPIRRAQLHETLARLTGSRRTEHVKATPGVGEHLERLRTLGLRVLVAEDNTVNQRVVSALMRRAGIEVELAANGQEALARLEERPFDLVLMDCQMPIVDGYAACRAIRAQQSSGVDPTIPVIALTAHALQGERQKCLDAGMDDYITKPIRPDELYAAIAGAVDLAAERRLSA